jgi:FSR family fosmidomycin resistance protein-like MFS transporter
MKSTPKSLKQITTNLFVYGTAHALIDAICAGVVFSILKSQLLKPEIFGILVIVYNMLAFGTQTIFGSICDFLKTPRTSAILGCILVGAAAYTFLHSPILAVVLAGTGNALFHVGGGSISLNLNPQKATAPGIFVAPGALGLAIGTLLGKNGQFTAWPFVIALSFFSVLMFIVQKPKMDYKKELPVNQKFNYFEFILLLILFAIAIRSMVGMAIEFPWKTNTNLLILVTLAVVLGKGTGGFLADKFGWRRIALGALVLSIPFLVFGANIPILAIIGMFLFNITMPVTLVAISNILPGRPGFAFGLTCLALLIGSLPAFSSLKNFLGLPIVVFIIIIISAIALYFGLWKYFNNFESKSTKQFSSLKEE